jgi:two-component system chemotaxis response regulator CheY
LDEDQMMTDLDISSLNVLIVEDNEHMQTLLREILRAFRVRNIRTAEDGADALKELRTFSADIILCDWNMKPVDGLEFTRLVRNAPDVMNAFVSIILITGHTEMARVYEARDVGVTEFLAKPVSARSLYDRICSAVLNPRPFISTKTYKGPDRRRGKPVPGHPNRRKGDKTDKEN